MDMNILAALIGSFLGKASAIAVPPPPPPPPAVVVELPRIEKEFDCEVTAYTSRPEETDDTPFIAASGHTVHWGMVASNAYPFGTQLRFPDLYGDKVFVVKDRMHSRYTSRMDIWFPEYEKAKSFGLKKTKVQVLRERWSPEVSMK